LLFIYLATKVASAPAFRHDSPRFLQRGFKVFKKITLATLLAAAALQAGCATTELVPMARVDQDAKAKSFSTKLGKAKVYVYRNQMLGPNARMSVVLDGESLGRTVAKTYVVAEVEPGKHTLESKAENDSKLEFDAQAGKNYFVRQGVLEGTLSAKTRLQIVDDATGKAGVRECQLIEMTN
jgi:hypothetical protein